jgi:hypothetical protein
MPIVESDIKYYQSKSTGSADGEPEFNGLGGYRSSTEIVDDTVENVFDNINAAESEAGDVEYRCIFARNEHATLTLEAARAYLYTNSPMCALATQLENSGSETTVVVDDNSAFPSKGTFFIENEEINYTGKSVGNDQFTGCTRGYNGTSKVLHIVTTKCEHNQIRFTIEAPSPTNDGPVQVIATESTDPIGLTFSDARTFADGEVIGDLAPDEKYAIWIRRSTGKDSQALSSIYTHVRVQGSTGA